MPPSLVSPDAGADPNSPFPAVHAPTATVIDESRLEYDFDDLKSRIGVGTYGAVYVGRYFGELVAIKRVRVPQTSLSAAATPAAHRRRTDAIRQFAREIRRYERVSHPGIVRFLGVTLPPDSSALLVTQLMRGGSLGEALAGLNDIRIPFHRPSFFRIAIQACSGLSALHAAGCTWGDAKPENILLSAPLDAFGVFPFTAEARIADFGLSRSVGQSLLTGTTVGGTGELAGTYNYMAPESFTGSNPDDPEMAKAADVYAFALVIYEMLTLRTPWKGRPLTEIPPAVLNGVRPPWPVETDQDYRLPVPDALRPLVERCWHQAPERRPTAEQLCSELEKCMNLYERLNPERRVSDITAGPQTSSEMPPAATLQRVLSKQSSASTAVPLPLGESLDLSSTAGSGAPNARFEDTGDDGHILYDSLTSPRQYVPPSAARVSPVTSPEPRSLNTVPNRTLENEIAQATPGDERQLVDTTGTERLEGGGGSLGPFETVHVLDSDTAITEEAVGLHDRKLRNSRSNNLQGTSSTDSKDPAETAPVAVPHHAASAGSRPHRLTRQWSNPNESALLATVDGSVHDLNASTTSSISLRRLRSRRLQSIIEHATMAFLEAHRREEMATRMPPKVRREAADRKAEEEQRQMHEREALKFLEQANARYDFSTVLDIMKRYQDLLPVVKECTTILEVFCSQKNLFSDLCDEGAVEQLISAATLFGKQDPALSAGFCRAMTALSKHYDDKTGHLIRADGVPAMVIEIMDQHKNEIPVQIVGCECLAAIAGASELSRSAVATLGGPRAVYIAMTRNNASFRDVPLARAALSAVRQIAQDNELAAEFLVNVSALDCVSKSAEVFTDDGLETDILSALRAFSFYNGGRRNIIMSSGLTALTSIMLRNRDPDFLVQCCTFIRSIARWRDIECEEAMLQSCIAERITTLMQMSNDIPGEEGARVAWYASHACTFLASFGSRSRQRLRLVGAIETAIGVLNNRRENARVVHSATDALAELIKSEPESRLYAEQYNAIPSLQAALELHASISRVRNALQWTIDYLSSTQGSNPGPALGSRVYQELMSTEEPASQHKPEAAPQSRPTRFLGFGWIRGKGSR